MHMSNPNPTAFSELRSAFMKCMDAALSLLEKAGNPHFELPRQLANPGSVGGQAYISKIRAPQPLRVPRTLSGSKGQICQ